ncbi:hypothetical protein [Chondromyces apiculatus]|uniref:Uncharacterized protein n=1 Tax=Chondromyces apiculatus DSM 436 TaxID=1192034 RepID=A0A017TGE9_9BACT|nr:hypothetical protein [Chondromyces apiculatus]EYF08373.1 Hypothetical protein CAP_4989 [Chondromyces apiculatus DSM 436]
MTDTAAHPFVFFGVEPSDWFPLEKDLFSYELCFVTAPEPATRRAIAEAFERTLGRAAVETVEPFVWADRWALLRLRPSGWSRKDVAAMARAVEKALAAVHAACPLDQVMLAEVMESDGDWEAWSSEQRPEPLTGPRWSVELPNAGSAKRFEATGAVDAEVEQVRAQIRAEAAEAGQHGGWQGAGEDEDGGDESARQDGPRTKAPLSVEKLGKESPVAIPEEITKLFGRYGVTQVAPNGRAYGLKREKRHLNVPSWVDDNGVLQSVADAGDLPRNAGTPTVAGRGDGGAVLLAFDSEGVWEAVFGDGTLRKLVDDDDTMYGLGYGPEGSVLLLAGDELRMYRRAGEGTELAQRWDVNGYEMICAASGRIAIVTESGTEEGDDDGVTLYGIEGDTLRRLRRVTFSVSQVAVKDDRVFLNDSGVWFELLGVQALLDGLAANPAVFPTVDVAKDRDDSNSDDDSSDDSDGDDDSSGDSDGDGDDDSDASDDSGSDDSGSDDRRSDDSASEDDDGEQEPEVMEGSLRLEREEVSSPHGYRAVEPALRSLFGRSSSVVKSPLGKVYGVAKQGRKPSTAAWVEEGELQVAAGTLPRDSATLAVREDETAALYGFSYSGVWELSFAEKQLRPLIEMDDSLMDAAYGPEGTIFVLLGSTMAVYQREGEAYARTAEYDVNAYELRTMCGGHVLLVKGLTDDDGNDTLFVYGYDGRTLRKMGLIRAYSIVTRIEGSSAFLLDSEHRHRIDGLEELRAQLDLNSESFPEVDLAPTQDDEEEEDDDEDGTPRPPKRRADSFGVEPAPGRVGLRYLGEDRPVPERSDSVTKAVRSAFGTGAKHLERASIAGEAYMGWKKEGKRAYRFAVYMDGQLSETGIVVSDPSMMMALSWDGRYVAATSAGDSKLWWGEAGQSSGAVLVHDFGKDEDEVYNVEVLAFGRVVVGTSAQTYLFAVSGGKATLEVSGELDVTGSEAMFEGRVVALEARGDKPTLLWAICEDGARVLDAFELSSSEWAWREDGRLIVETMGEGWYEFTQVEEAWEAARRDTSGATYPRVALTPPAPAEEKDEDDEDDDDEGEGDEGEDDGEEEGGEGEGDEDEDDD